MKTIYLPVIALFLLISSMECQAIEKAVKLYIPDTSNVIIGAVVVGILDDVPGVRHARVNGMDSAATVFFDNETTSVGELKKVLTKAHIKVESDTVPRDAQGRLITK